MDVSPFLLAIDDQVQRRLGNVEVALRHEFRHLAVEKGHEESPDVRTVDISAAHHHDLAVPPFAGIFLLADAVADSRDNIADFFIAQNAVKPGSLDVEYLTAQWKDRLIDSVSTPLRRPAG